MAALLPIVVSMLDLQSFKRTSARKMPSNFPDVAVSLNLGVSPLHLRVSARTTWHDKIGPDKEADEV